MKENKKFSVTRLGEILCVILILAMVMITFVNVCSRYVFHQSIAASEEITTNLFVVLSLIGAALALKNHSHIGLNLFTDKMEPVLREWFRVLEGCAGMLFLGVLTFYGVKRVLQQYNTGMISASLAMPLWIYGLLCLIGFIVLFVAFAEVAVEAILRLVRHDPLPNGAKGDKKEDKS